MRSLEIPKWINANNAYMIQQNKGLVNGNHVNGDTKKTKAERSTELGIGLARLALRCHVSPALAFCNLLMMGGIQIIRTCTQENANDGPYPLCRSSETVNLGFKHHPQTRKMVRRNGEIRRGRTAGQGENRMGQRGNGCIV